MNEQIRELWRESVLKHTNDPMNWQTVADEFAELIVRKCLEQIDKIRDGCEADNEDQQALGADWAGLAVSRYFGVKE
jgi:hypothetical protein